MIVSVDDFKDKWAVNVAYGSNKLQEYINEYEPQIIAELLGAEFGAEFTQQVEDETLTPENEKLYLPNIFNIERCGKNWVFTSRGVVEMLKNFIYSHAQVGDLGTPTSQGKIKMNSEGGSLVNDNYTDRFRFYNDGVKTFRAIQQFIKEHKEDYPDFKGVEKDTIWLI